MGFNGSERQANGQVINPQPTSLINLLSCQGTHIFYCVYRIHIKEQCYKIISNKKPRESLIFQIKLNKYSVLINQFVERFRKHPFFCQVTSSANTANVKSVSTVINIIIMKFADYLTTGNKSINSESLQRYAIITDRLLVKYVTGSLLRYLQLSIQISQRPNIQFQKG